MTSGGAASGKAAPGNASGAESTVDAALEIARYLIRSGVPVFACPPATNPDGSWDPRGGTGHSGYHFPPGWERTIPTENWLDPRADGRFWAEWAWRPGYALAAVMGHAVDGFDCDPRNGGEASVAQMQTAGLLPRMTGRQRTPSGGWHGLLAPLGVRSRDDAWPGVDIKAGEPNGSGRGFFFIAPTVKLSKATGKPAPYVWEIRPDLAELDGDTSGEPLADAIRVMRSSKSSSSSSSADDPFSSVPRRFTMAEAVAFCKPRIDDLRAAQDGSINRALNIAAVTLSHFINGGFWTREQGAEFLLTALSETVYDGKTWQAEDTIRSGFSAKGWVAELAPDGTEDTAPEDKPMGFGWGPVDLTAFIDGQGVDPPTVGKREDAECMFYRGMTNVIFGESEGGKSWLALIAATQEICDNRHVTYLDWEDGPAGIVERLRLLGCPPEKIRAYFTYVSPEGPLDDAAKAAMTPLMQRSSLVVLDATTEALAHLGLNSNADVDVASFLSTLPRWAAAYGPAVVLIDHVPKNKDNRDSQTGSQHKKAGADGSSFRVDPVELFSRGGTGRSRVYVSKNRHGHVRAAAVDGKWWADFTLDNTRDGVVWYRLHVPIASPGGVGPDDGLAPVREKILEKMREARAVGKDEVSQTYLLDRLKIGVGEPKLKAALAGLVDAGVLLTRPGARNSTQYRLAEEAPGE